MKNLILLFLTFAFLNLFIYFYQPRLVFFPFREIEITPSAIGLSFQEVQFPATDGTILSGWFIEQTNPKGVILFCHGNAGNISHRLDSIKIFHELGYAVFIFDYRGYGNSAGRPSEKGFYQDADGALRYLSKEKSINSKDIVAFGRSLGAAVAARLAAEHTLKGCIIESSFTSAPDMAARMFPFLPARYLCRYRFNTMKWLKRNNNPVLIVHSAEDEIIPFDFSQKLFKAANHPKNLLKIHGDHNTGFLLSGSTYTKGLELFLNTLDV